LICRSLISSKMLCFCLFQSCRIFKMPTLLIIITQLSYDISFYTWFIQFLEPYYMLLTTKPKKIDTIYAITKSEMVPIPHPSVRSKSAYSKYENRSLVNFTWTCNVSMVAFKTIVCPLFFNIKNYSFLLEFIISCSENVQLDNHYYTWNGWW
jgi:hypothetical protein